MSEDRGREGNFRRNVLENLVAAKMPKYTRAGLLSWAGLRHFAKELCRRVTLDNTRLDANAFDLSGGNQQKIFFARALGNKEPGVILINEPTHGVDVGARAEIYRLLREFCEMDYILLMASSDLEEVVGIADTVVTMYRGKMVSTYQRGRISSLCHFGRHTHQPKTTEWLVSIKQPASQSWLQVRAHFSGSARTRMAVTRAVVLIALLIWAALTPSFLSAPSLTALLTTASVIGCLSAGMTFITISGNVMSFALGATAASSAVVLLLLLNAAGLIPAFIGALLFGASARRIPRLNCGVDPRKSDHRLNCSECSDLRRFYMVDRQ